jgi:hypothetical protein
MIWFRIALTLALVVPVLGAEPKLIRGPYLQMPTTNSVVIRWRTDKPTKGYLRYGRTPERATNRVSHSGVLTEHIVRLGGLKPDTRYYYAVGTETNKWLSPATNTVSFVTPPPVGPAKPTRIWVIGDPGTANANQRAVRDAFYRWNRGHAPDLWLMLGDNAYNTGTDSEYQNAVFNMYAWLAANSPLWPTLGNHDAGSANSGTQSGVYYDIFTLPTLGQAGGLPSGTEAYYSFDHANIHFICLDSHDTDRAKDGAMAQWLRADLEATARDWIICYFHHPPYTKGSHDSDNKDDSSGRMVQMRENILPILEQGGVDLVMTGHSHCYERSYLLDGHYGYSTNLAPHMFKDRGDGRVDGNGAYTKSIGTPAHEGAVYVVAGSSGKISGGKLNHPVNFVSLNKLGSVVLDIDGQELNAKFITDKGQLRDYFTLRKR